MRNMVLLFLVMWVADAHAAHMSGGIVVDTSSNMLLRPDGASGTIMSVYGDFGHTFDRADISYNFNGGMIERYNGVQYHQHELDVSYDIVTRRSFSADMSVNGSVSRYGDVTIIDGYEQYSLSGRIKSYLTATLLLRGETEIRRRSYRSYGSENYSEADFYARLDKFMQTGTTVRGQIDLGVRRYDERDMPGTSLYGIRVRLAQSLGPRWGSSAEVHATDISTGSTDDSSQIFDRIFLDDRYKYSSQGVVLSVKHLLEESGNISLSTVYKRRDYGSSLSSLFVYLPADGWKEDEFGFYFTVARNFAFLSDRVYPSIEIYHIDVAASSNEFSYKATGLTVRFNIY